MKRLFIVLAAAMMTANVMAQHEIGVIAGGINGVSYKYWCTDNLALQTDLAVGLTTGPCCVSYQGRQLVTGDITLYDFTLNPNLAYHFQLPADLQLYSGLGANLGFASNFDSDGLLGKFGANGIVGLSWFATDKIALAFDFRPGYGLLFDQPDSPMIHYFDWKLGLAVRYRI